MKEYIQQLPPDKLVPFRNHPLSGAGGCRPVGADGEHPYTRRIIAVAGAAKRGELRVGQRTPASFGSAEAGAKDCSSAGEGDDR